jgi:hypothetical protein
MVDGHFAFLARESGERIFLKMSLRENSGYSRPTWVYLTKTFAFTGQVFTFTPFH